MLNRCIMHTRKCSCAQPLLVTGDTASHMLHDYLYHTCCMALVYVCAAAAGDGGARRVCVVRARGHAAHHGRGGPQGEGAGACGAVQR